MNDNIMQAYKQAVRLMFSQKSVAEGMCELDAFVRNLVPHPIWDKLRQFSFEEEFTELTEWVRGKVTSEPEGIAILFFCLSDLGDSMSLIFMQQREPEGDSDWSAYDSSNSSNVPSHVLSRLHELAERELSDTKGGYTDPEVHWIVETCYPLVYSGLSVCEIMRSLPSSILLGKDARRRVAVFFGEGDDFLLGEVTRSGFSLYEVPGFAL
jgi:hypothetical protein